MLNANKFVKEEIPPERRISKQGLLKRVHRVHDVMLQDSEEHQNQILGISDKNAKKVGNAIGELIKMNEKMILQFNEKVEDTKRDLHQLIKEERDGLKSALVESINNLSKSNQRQLETHLENTDRVIVAARKELQRTMNDTVTNIQKIFNDKEKFIKSQIRRIEDSVPIRAEKEVEKYLKDITIKADSVVSSLSKFHIDTVQAVTKFELEMRDKIGKMSNKYDRVIEKFKNLSKEFSS